MSFSDIVLPRPEVLKKDGIEGVIDIENLNDKKKKSVESRPEDFFDLTYPTADVKLVLEIYTNDSTPTNDQPVCIC